jgi:6-phosphogluconate dehydrogenase
MKVTGEYSMSTHTPMQIGMVGLGRMGANLARRLIRDGHTCVVYDIDADAVASLTKDGANASKSVTDLIGQLSAPRTVWVMVPAGDITATTITEVAAQMAAGDIIIIDGGNSYYSDDIRRAADLGTLGINLVDCGTCGGVWGIDRGYCLMIGGDTAVIKHLDPIFATIAPAMSSATRTPGRPVTARTATCTAEPTERDTSSRWCTTASSTA